MSDRRPTIAGDKRPRQLKGYVLFKILTKGIYTTFTRSGEQRLRRGRQQRRDHL